MQRVDGVEPGNGLDKHRKMATSPFVFLRGSSSQFYQDIADGLLDIPEQALQIPLTAVMGDCHISNFGLFSEEGSHGDHLIFAPNDFDDACIGHAVWDLMRYAVSLILCADHCQGVKQGSYQQLEKITKTVVDNTDVKKAVDAFFSAYISSCEKLASGEMSYRTVRDTFDTQHILSKRFLKAQQRICGGNQFHLKSSLAKAVDLEANKLRFRNLPDRFARISDDEYRQLEQHLAPYVDDQIIDIVVRLGAGTGSVNMKRYYLLVGPGAENKAEDWPLYHVVEIKKQRHAAPLNQFATLSPINQLSAAHLTVVCQRRMQRNPDLVLDEIEWQGEHWLVRSRHHAKVGIDPEHIACGKKACNGGFKQYAETCAHVLALAHARGDRRSNRFETQAAQHLSAVKDELLANCYRYAEQVTEDWRWLSSIES